MQTLRMVSKSSLGEIFRKLIFFNILKLNFFFFFSGLIAAKEFVGIFPALREAVFVASSVYFASRDVRFYLFNSLH